MPIKNKKALKRIAKRWCQSILLMNDIVSETTCKLLTEDEQDYIIQECKKIAFRIIKEIPSVDLDEIIEEELKPLKK